MHMCMWIFRLLCSSDKMLRSPHSALYHVEPNSLSPPVFSHISILVVTAILNVSLCFKHDLSFHYSLSLQPLPFSLCVTFPFLLCGILQVSNYNFLSNTNSLFAPQYKLIFINTEIPCDSMQTIYTQHCCWSVFMTLMYSKYCVPSGKISFLV